MFSSSAGTSEFSALAPPSSISGRSWRDEDRFTKVFSRDFAPTEIVEALEADLLMELASLDFRPTEDSEDFRPTETSEDFRPSEAFEDFRPLEASEDFGPTEASEDFLDVVVVGFALTRGSASLEALLVLFLLVTLTEDVVLTSFCSFDSFRVLAAAVCFARVVEEDVLNTCCCSFPLALLLLLLLLA